MKTDEKTASIDTLETRIRNSLILDYSLNYDEPSSTDFNTSTKRVQGNGNAEVEETLDGFRSDKRVRLLRDTMLMLLLIITLFVTLAVYFSQSASEQEDFEKAFKDQALEVGHALRSELEAKLLVLDAFSVSIKSHSLSQESSNWPFVTIPDFAERASSTLRACKGISLALHPIVQSEELTQWEEYSVKSQAWLQESLKFQSMESSEALLSSANRISEVVYRVEHGTPTEIHDSVRFLPLWEHFPVQNGLPPVNYDVLTDRLHRYALEEVLENGAAVMGQAFDLSRSFHG